MEYNTDGRIRVETSNDVVAICRELNSSLISAEKNAQSAHNIIQKLFKNKSIDLCSILEPSDNVLDHPFDLVLGLIHHSSQFFNTVIEDDSLCEELWNAVVSQCENSCMDPQYSSSSVLFSAVSGYVVKLLPCDDSMINKTPQRNTKTHQTIRTPLQMFRATSPLVNRISIEDRTELFSSNANLQPRFVTVFCSLINKVCSTTTFPTPNRVVLLRYLLKQFHIFCLYETFDEYTDTLKNAMLAEPLFMSQLYNFFLVSLHHCPTISLFKDITMCWLTYCRPWRYEKIDDSQPVDTVQIARYMPFAKKNFEFYHILLGKIIKKFSSHGVTLEITPIMKAIVEFSWREPHCILLRNVGLDVQPHVIALLEEMKTVVGIHRSIVQKEQFENSGFFNSLFGADSNKSEGSIKLVREIQSMMNDCDKYLATKFLSQDNLEASPNETQYAESNRTFMSSILNETPKTTYLLPEHAVDSKSNLMILTPNGKKQVLNGERKFDFSKFKRRDALSTASKFEYAPLVSLLTRLSEEMSTLMIVQNLASQYSSRSVIGKFARIVMYPPIPNPDPDAAAPVYSPRIRKSPPLLKLRIFSNFVVISAIFYLILAQMFGRYFVIPSLIIGFLLLVFVFAVEADSSY